MKIKTLQSPATDNNLTLLRRTTVDSSAPSLHFLTLSPLSLSPVFADGGVTSRLPLRAAAQTDEETHRRDSIPYLSLNPIASKRLLFQTLRNNKLEAVQTQCSREG